MMFDMLSEDRNETHCFDSLKVLAFDIVNITNYHWLQLHVYVTELEVYYVIWYVFVLPYTPEPKCAFQYK